MKHELSHMTTAGVLTNETLEAARLVELHAVRHDLYVTKRSVQLLPQDLLEDVSQPSGEDQDGDALGLQKGRPKRVGGFAGSQRGERSQKKLTCQTLPTFSLYLPHSAGFQQTPLSNPGTNRRSKKREKDTMAPRYRALKRQQVSRTNGQEPRTWNLRNQKNELQTSMTL
jgi:hypothetical protein